MIYDRIIASRVRKEKQLAVLIDPDKAEGKRVVQLARAGQEHGLDLFLVGGSLMMKDRMEAVIRLIRNNCGVPVVLFPGSVMQVSSNADAMLLLSLISGRNPEFLIDRHVAAAPLIRRSRLEVIPTGYMLFGNGRLTSVHYLSGTFPIPSDKPDIAVCTAMAGEMLGLRMLYLEAGSGASQPVPEKVVREVRANVNVPLIVGGGLRENAQLRSLAKAGADLLVVGTALEDAPGMLGEMISTVKEIR